MLMSGGVHMSGSGKRRQYDRAFKVEAVRLVIEERDRRRAFECSQVASPSGSKWLSVKCST